MRRAVIRETSHCFNYCTGYCTFLTNKLTVLQPFWGYECVLFVFSLGQTSQLVAIIRWLKVAWGETVWHIAMVTVATLSVILIGLLQCNRSHPSNGMFFLYMEGTTIHFIPWTLPSNWSKYSISIPYSTKIRGSKFLWIAVFEDFVAIISWICYTHLPHK